MCVYVLFPSSTSSTYIALQPLCVFDLSSTSSTYFNIHLLWLVAGSLESAYSLNWGAREIWGQDLGTFMISRPI